MSYDFIPGVSLHARERAVQRLGRDPSRDDWLAAVASILHRRALLLAAHLPDGKERWRVQLGPVECDVWWSPPCAMIVTLVDAGQPALNPARRQERQAGQRQRRVTEPYRRQRARLEDWT